MSKTPQLERVEVTFAAQLRTWLERHYQQPESIWLVLFKKHVADQYVSIEAVLDEIICFGWIDGRALKLDADRVMRLIGLRRVHHWAGTYKTRAERLIREGRMHAAGLEAISESKRRGLWDFMTDVDALEIPEDLAIALAAYPSATTHFDAFSASSKRFVLRWIKIAKTPRTRTNRIEQTAALAAKGERVPGSC